MQKTYLVYVTGKDKANKSRIIPMTVEASGSSIQRKKHIEEATTRALGSGMVSVSEVFLPMRCTQQLKRALRCKEIRRL